MWRENNIKSFQFGIAVYVKGKISVLLLGLLVSMESKRIIQISERPDVENTFLFLLKAF